MKDHIPKQDPIEIELHDDNTVSLTQKSSVDGSEQVIILADKQALKRLASILWDFVRSPTPSATKTVEKSRVENYFPELSEQINGPNLHFERVDS